MHILFLSDNFPPEVNAPASRTFEHCREWVRAGHQVTVITCVPNFPSGKVHSGYENKSFQTETMDGIDVVRVWSYITANEGIVKRTADYVSFMIMAVWAAQWRRGADIIVATSPQFFTAIAGFLVSLTHWRPWIFELRDLWPESFRAVGAIRNEFVLKFLEAIELFLYHRATRVVAVTHAFKANLIQRGILADKISVITNGADLSRFAPIPKDDALLDTLGLRSKFVLGYIGTHGMAHGLDTVLQAAEQLQANGHTDMHFLFLGEGAEKKNLVALAAARHIFNVTFVDTVPKSEVARYWSVLDVSVIHLKKDPLFTTVIPSKLFECMAMGIPVLHGVEGESADIVTKEGVGLTFEPSNATALIEGALRLKNDADLRQQIHARAVAASKSYDRKALANDMLSILVQTSNISGPH